MGERVGVDVAGRAAGVVGHARRSIDEGSQSCYDVGGVQLTSLRRNRPCKTSKSWAWPVKSASG